MQFDTQQILSDFDLLIEQGQVGFYTHVEVTEVVAYSDAQPKDPINLLTLVVFEEWPEHREVPKPRFLNSNGRIRSKYPGLENIGVFRYALRLDVASPIIRGKLIPTGQLALNDKLLVTGRLQFLPKQYIPASWSYFCPLSGLLKNNHHNGSYVLEGFDETKSKIRPLLDSPQILDAISVEVRRHVPLKLRQTSDRLGNVLLQFPISLAHVSLAHRHDDTGMNVKLAWHPAAAASPPPCSVISTTELPEEHSLMAFGIAHLDLAGGAVLTGNTRHVTTSWIVRDDSQLVLGSFRGTYIETINTDLNVGMGDIRRFYAGPPGRTSKKLEEVEITVPRFISSSLGKKVSASEDYQTWISGRKYNTEKKRLESDLALVQYGNSQDDSERALEDIRRLLRRHGKKAVWLWDPYLSANDVRNTLFYCQYAGAQLRALSSYNRDKAHVYKELMEFDEDEQLTFDKWVAYQRTELSEQAGEQHGAIDIEFRVQHGKHGFKFHDRFLLIPASEAHERAQVWSLGTSVNSLGKFHHILFKVGHPQAIVDAFKDLWEALTAPECRVWPHDSAKS